MLEAWKQRIRDELRLRAQEAQRAPDQRPQPIAALSAPEEGLALPIARATGGSFHGAPGRDRFGAAEDLRRRLQEGFTGRGGETEVTAKESAETLGEVKKGANISSNALSVVPLHDDAAARMQTLGSSTARSAGGIAGVAAALFGFAHHSKNAELHKADLVLDGGNATVGGSQSVAAAKEAKALKAGASVDDAANAAGKLGTVARFGGLALGIGAGALEMFRGAKEDNKVKMAQGGVTIAGTVAGFAAVGAVGGPAGIAVGAGIGLATFGVRWGIGKFFGKE